MLIEKIMKDAKTEGHIIDVVLLSHDELLRPHQKVVSQGGKELHISLDRGQQLFCGAVLYQDETTAIVVDMPEEKVFEVCPKTTLEWAKVAFNIGNMHQGCYLYPDCIRVPYDYVLENMMEALDVDFEITDGKLDGIRPNVSSGHGHGHSHNHHER